jgi:Flp pilus assembly protein TadB
MNTIRKCSCKEICSCTCTYTFSMHDIRMQKRSSRFSDFIEYAFKPLYGFILSSLGLLVMVIMLLCSNFLSVLIFFGYITFFISSVVTYYFQYKRYKNFNK